MAQHQIPAGVNVWTLDMSSEANGIYFIQVQSEGQGVTRRVLKVQ
ncbi:MAG: T9SS type A sorting domain-containing protein [Flavobacteriales bacterium]